MSTLKVLVIGSATVDLIFRGSIFSKRKIKDRLSLAYGGKYAVEEFYQFFGGGAANASVSLRRQNFEV
jgi:sugar/nucleoside kinase (ribokinase family)